MFVPKTQDVLLLHAPRQPQTLTQNYAVPTPLTGEVLVRVDYIGLNPVDWKSADYNFALPVLPAVSGRDFSGTIVQLGSLVTKWKIGDKVFGASTQYRDYRTSTFQSYIISLETSIARIPSNISAGDCAGAAVGIVAAALAISSSLNIKIRDFAPRSLAIGAEGEPSLVISENKEKCNLSLGRQAYPSPPTSPAFSPLAISDSSEGEWIVIWGASSTTGYYATQLAKIAGLRVIAVVDAARHGSRLLAINADHIVDRSDSILAIAEIRRISNGNAKLALDCIGASTASHLVESLSKTEQSWLVGLAGTPKVKLGHVSYCEVPIKTFHSNPAIGDNLMRLVEDLLSSGELIIPPSEVIEGGLGAVNLGLDRLRKGDVGFGRLVVRA